MALTIQILLGFVPSLAWLMFYLQEGIHPEPKRLLALSFLNGAIFAFLALLIQFSLKPVLIDFSIAPLSPLGLFLFAGIEEVLKFMAAYAAVHKSPGFDHPVEAMLYVVVAALGFAAVENVGVLVGSSQGSFMLASVVHVVTFRFIGATLLHTLASGICGYYWAKSIRRFNAKRYILWGIFLATLLHAAFNFVILQYSEIGLSVALVMIAGFFVLADFEKLKPKML